MERRKKLLKEAISVEKLSIEETENSLESVYWYSKYSAARGILNSVYSNQQWFP